MKFLLIVFMFSMSVFASADVNEFEYAKFTKDGHSLNYRINSADRFFKR